MEKHNEGQLVNKLTLFSDSNSLSESISQEIERSSNLSVSRYRIAQFDKQDPKTLNNVVVSFTGGLQYTLNRMSEGVLPQKAVTEWCNHAREVLQIARKRRGKVFLFEEVSFCTDFDVISEHLESKLDVSITRRNALFDDETLEDPIQIFLAQQALQLNPIARRLQSELVACCSIDPPRRPIIDPDAAFSRINEYHNEVIQRNADRLRETESVLECKISDLAESEINFAQVEKEKEEAQQKLSISENEKSTLELKIRDISLENQKLSSRVKWIWDELEDALKDANELRKINDKIDHLKDENRIQFNEIEALRNSTSWKITAPIRAIRLALSGKGK